MLSHQLKQFVIDGKKSFIQNPNEAQKKEVEKCEFDVNEVYAVDVIVSSNKAAKVILCFFFTIFYMNQYIIIVILLWLDLKYTLYTINVVMKQQGREMETKASVYKRTKDTVYNLKMKASRQFLSEVDNKYGMMPFTMR